MKSWPQDHPKAGLMARKRMAILEAARDEFLRAGYAGTSMERVAAAAGVSIMTLYRHAEGKDDLFGAVVERACTPDPSDAAHQKRYAALLAAPLAEALGQIGLMIQERLAAPHTTGLLRMVIASGGRSPDLAATTYRGMIESHVDKLADFLAQRPEAAHLTPQARARHCTAFIDAMVGLETLRRLLGLQAASGADRHERATMAAQKLIADLESAAPQ